MDALSVSAFTVALAEIGDKTQLLSLFLAARFRNKRAIVLGVLVATVLNHAVSAWLGAWAATYLQSEVGKAIVSGSFVLLGIWLLFPDKDDNPDSRLLSYGAFTASTALFFIAEIGDKTQVATVLLAAQYESVFLVTLGTTLGMLLANLPIIYAGHHIMKYVPLSIARVVASLAFVVVGLGHILW